MSCCSSTQRVCEEALASSCWSGASRSWSQGSWRRRLNPLWYVIFAARAVGSCATFSSSRTISVCCACGLELLRISACAFESGVVLLGLIVGERLDDVPAVLGLDRLRDLARLAVEEGDLVELRHVCALRGSLNLPPCSSSLDPASTSRPAPRSRAGAQLLLELVRVASWCARSRPCRRSACRRASRSSSARPGSAAPCASPASGTGTCSRCSSPGSPWRDLRAGVRGHLVEDVLLESCSPTVRAELLLGYTLLLEPRPGTSLVVALVVLLLDQRSTRLSTASLDGDAQLLRLEPELALDELADDLVLDLPVPGRAGRRERLPCCAGSSPSPRRAAGRIACVIVLRPDDGDVVRRHACQRRRRPQPSETRATRAEQ